MDPIEETKEVDFVVGVEEPFVDPIPALAFLIVCVLIFIGLMCWLAISFHKADAGVKQWNIWSQRCEQIVNVNAESIRSEKDTVGYLDNCPEGPHNEPVTINR